MGFKPKQKVRYAAKYSIPIKNYTEELDEYGLTIRRECIVEGLNPKVVGTPPVENFSLDTLVKSGQPLRRIPTDVMTPNEFSEFDLERIAESIPDPNPYPETKVETTN